MFRWPEYNLVHDCDDIMLIDEEKTYALIEDMFSTLRQCFKTNKLHIGMDEAHNVGLGKFLIDELEEELLDFPNNGYRLNNYAKCASVNTI